MFKDRYLRINKSKINSSLYNVLYYENDIIVKSRTVENYFDIMDNDTIEFLDGGIDVLPPL